jgi:hypothetical protein
MKKEIKYMSKEERFIQWTKIALAVVGLTLFSIYLFAII